MTVLIVGCEGQVGRELMRTIPEGSSCVGVDLPDLDITDADAVRETFARVAPSLVVNVAAYTAVDLAESNREDAYAANERGARHLAAATRITGARMIHFSTDFVFDGSQPRPYAPGDEPNPLSVYGASKLAGEAAVSEELGEAGIILRTSWVYSAHGRNFAKTMLGLFREGREVSVVYDQVGTPTAAHDLARVVWRLATIESDLEERILHVTNTGVCSWYDFAVAIGEIGVEEGILATPPSVDPILSEQFPTAAARPSYSVLDTSRTWELVGYRLPYWRSALEVVLPQLSEPSNA